MISKLKRTTILIERHEIVVARRTRIEKDNAKKSENRQVDRITEATDESTEFAGSVNNKT